MARLYDVNVHGQKCHTASIDDFTVTTYLDVFKRIFDKSGHLPHYLMMMGEAATTATPITQP